MVDAAVTEAVDAEVAAVDAEQARGRFLLSWVVSPRREGLSQAFGVMDCGSCSVGMYFLFVSWLLLTRQDHRVMVGCSGSESEQMSGGAQVL